MKLFWIFSHPWSAHRTSNERYRKFIYAFPIKSPTTRLYCFSHTPATCLLTNTWGKIIDFFAHPCHVAQSFSNVKYTGCQVGKLVATTNRMLHTVLSTRIDIFIGIGIALVSSITDIVCRSVLWSEPTNNQSLGSIKEWPQTLVDTSTH